MADVTVSLDSILLKNKKTYIAGIASVVSGVLGYFGYVNADTGWTVATLLIAVAIVFSRMGTSKVQDQLAQVLDTMDQLKEEPEETK